MEIIMDVVLCDHKMESLKQNELQHYIMVIVHFSKFDLIWKVSC